MFLNALNVVELKHGNKKSRHDGRLLLINKQVNYNTNDTGVHRGRTTDNFRVGA